MNSVSERALQARLPDVQSLRILANWLKGWGTGGKRKTQDSRDSIRRRYPAGLITEAELDALLGGKFR